MSRAPGEIPTSTLRLLMARGIGPATVRRLREAFGSDDAAVEATPHDLRRVRGIGAGRATAIRESILSADPEAERAAMDRLGVRMILADDGDFPALLTAIPDPPAALWLRGTLQPEDNVALAIVGSRRCTTYGRGQAGRMASLLAQSGLTIVSGGASGIDGEAHRGVLRVGGRTIAVLGCGLGRVYPPEHGPLFERIVESGGALLSEFAMDAEPRPGNFPRRNRIISGLSLGVLVVEAARRSGALITARIACEDHGREAMALPGRVDSPASRGCLEAIRDGWVGLVLDHADVIGQLESAGHLVQGAFQAAGREGADLSHAGLSPGQQAIVSALLDSDAPMPPEELACRTRLPLGQVMADLTLLEVHRHVRRTGAGFVGR